jgi:transcriptional regulator with XRE-family HTH domain
VYDFDLRETGPLRSCGYRLPLSSGRKRGLSPIFLFPIFRPKRREQEEAADAAGVHPRHYQKLEEGSDNVTIGTLERLSRGFGVNVRRLFEP